MVTGSGSSGCGISGEQSSVLLYYYRIIVFVCCIGALIIYILNSLHHEVVRKKLIISSNPRNLYNTHTVTITTLYYTTIPLTHTTLTLVLQIHVQCTTYPLA